MALNPLDHLLAALDSDRDEAAQRYELLRRRLILFFSARHAAPADQWADEVLDRAARRISEGAAMEATVESFALGIARNVVQEVWKKPKPMLIQDWSRFEAPTNAPQGDAEMACLERCLGNLPDNQRSAILQFYSFTSGSEKIRARAQLANALGVDANALRVRMHRLRVSLESCVTTCLERNESGKETTPNRD